MSEHSRERGGARLKRLAFLLLPLLVWPLADVLEKATKRTDVPGLYEAEFFDVGGSAPPSANAAGDPRSLPDDWQRSARATLEGWYRLNFRADGLDDREWAVFLPAVAMNAAVFVNGEPVGDGGSFEEPIARRWNHPLFFPFPARLLVPGHNEIAVRVKADRPGGGLLGPVYVAPERQIRFVFERLRFLRVTLVEWILVGLPLTAAFTAFLWLGRRRETYYGWFTLGCLAWFAHNLELVVVDPPVPTIAWRWLWYCSLGWLAVCALRVALDFMGDSLPNFERSLSAYAALGPAALGAIAVAAPPESFDAAASAVLLPLTIPLSLFGVWRIARRLASTPNDVEIRVLYTGGFAMAVLGTHDIAAMNGIGSRLEGHVLQLAAPGVLAGMTWFLVRRLAHALRRAEGLAAELDRRIEETRHELEQNHERAVEIERRQVLSVERERIMREMHDGLGSRLVSMLALARRPDTSCEALAGALGSTLEDMRTMIDAFEPPDGELLPALGQLRARLQPRLEAAGIRVEWRVEDLPPTLHLGPREILEILRMVEEAFTNVLKHSEARTITVSTATIDGNGAIAIEVADDGKGLGPRPSPGRGMANMRRRADKVGAAVEFTSSAGGTAVRITLPAKGVE